MMLVVWWKFISVYATYSSIINTVCLVCVFYTERSLRSLYQRCARCKTDVNDNVAQSIAKLKQRVTTAQKKISKGFSTEDGTSQVMNPVKTQVLAAPAHLWGAVTLSGNDV